MKPILPLLLLIITPISVSAKEELKTISPCGAQTVNCTDIEENIYQEHKLERVIDGDTIVANEKTIRLWGIDAPEKNSSYYLASKLLLESLLQNGVLRCKFIEKDRYSRDVMHCLIETSDIGSLMVQAGMAENYSRYSDDYYLYEEKTAQAKKRGIWSKQ